MPEYQIQITKTAQKQLDKLPEQVGNTLIEAILDLSKNPRPHGCKKLKGRNGYRIRKGNFRVIYDVYDKVLIVEVIAIGDRKDVYD
jgi:mRNA interferase RelE/StbE